MEITEIDEYLDAILSKSRHSGGGINFMESPKQNYINL